MAETPHNIQADEQQPTREMYVFGGRAPMAILRLPAVKPHPKPYKPTDTNRLFLRVTPSSATFARRLVSRLSPDSRVQAAASGSGPDRGTGSSARQDLPSSC